MAQREKNLGCVQSESSIMFGLNLCDQILNNRKKFPADCLNMVEHLQKKKSYLSLIFGFSLKKVMVIMYPMLKSRDLTCRSVFKRLRTHQEKGRQGEITVERRRAFNNDPRGLHYWVFNQNKQNTVKCYP